MAVHVLAVLWLDCQPIIPSNGHGLKARAQAAEVVRGNPGFYN
jgi:hypothetical protein